MYENSYLKVRKFVEDVVDICKYELATIVYSVLVHMYIESLYNGHLMKLAMGTRKDQISGNDLADTFTNTRPPTCKN